jgi:hypothetical protein
MLGSMEVDLINSLGADTTVELIAPISAFDDLQDALATSQHPYYALRKVIFVIS